MFLEYVIIGVCVLLAGAVEYAILDAFDVWR